MKTMIAINKFQAVIFDLDGVITKTADVHSRAWKQMFDQFLEERDGADYQPFEGSDYLNYVDGKPRMMGIQSFLESRGIELSEEGVNALGDKKNNMFTQELEDHGVEVYPSTVELIHKLRKAGIKTALISSSKNCIPIIKKVGLFDQFDTIIEGLETVRRGLKGKPDPDVFVEAAKDIGVNPSHAVVVEDAISGVQSGKQGGFGLVIGVDRSGQAEELLKNGADVVVQDLEEVALEPPKNALASMGEIVKFFDKKKLAIFLDYDGTVTPIVSHPDLANISKSMKKTLEKLCERYTVAIISGRDLPDVKKHVGIEGIFYAGSHGFDIGGPNNQRFENDEGKGTLPSLDKAEKELKDSIPSIKGAWVERKKYSVAIHYRQVAAEDESKVEEIVDRVHGHYKDLRKALGKKIFELQPDISWNKGTALHWLLKKLDLAHDGVIPIYFGDDVTDEDAFRALIIHGLGIAVQDEPKLTAAHYVLKDPDEVEQFFERLMDEV